jgi:SAM-dependent methyltransferase
MRDPLTLAHEYDDAASFERAVLSDIERSLGYDAAFLVAKGSGPTAVTIDQPALTRAMNEGRYEHELMPLKRAAMASGGVVIDTEILGESGVRQTAYYRDFAAPMGGRHTLLGFLSLRGAPVGALMLGRQGRFSASEARRLREFLPALAVARASFGAYFTPPALPARPSLTSWLGGARVLERVQAEDFELLVRDCGDERQMVARSPAGELVWSRALRREPYRSGWFYIDLLGLALARARRQRRVLLIGCGGGVALHHLARLYPQVSFDVAEPDARVVTLAHRWFGLGSIPRTSVHVSDGVELVRAAADGSWDAILVDAYGMSLPAGFATRPFFAEVCRTLAPGGSLAFNVIGPLRGQSAVQVVESAAQAELTDVRLVPVLDPGEAFDPHVARNVIVLASRP